MRWYWYFSFTLMCAWAGAVSAQTPGRKSVPVEDRGHPAGATQLQQQRTGTAFRALEQARHDAKLAEQEYVNADDAYRAAQKRADTLNNELSKLKKTRDAAKEKETASAKAYESALNAGSAR